jgi:uncharacterized protein YsxB (DUF464 family)
LKAEEFARLKHEVETRQTYVDKAFATLDDFVQKHDDQAERDTPSEIARKEMGEKVVLLERLIEEMSRLNASYGEYVQVLEKKVGF